MKKILLSITLCTALGLIGACKKRGTSEKENVTPPVQIPVVQNELSKALGCDCNPADFPATAITFTAPYMKPEDIAYIMPLGLMLRGHVTPTSHQYYMPPDVVLGAAASERNVLSPADGYIVRVTRTPETQAEAGVTPRDGYAIYIQHNCTLYSDISLITSLPSDIAAAVGTIARGQMKNNLKIKVSAGQTVARVGGQGIDVVVLDLNTIAKQYIIPSHYTEIGKTYKADPFPFYTQTIRDQLYAKTMRTTDPKGGRFDYDIDGRAVGTWFLQNSNFFTGLTSLGGDYWRGHLTLAYNFFDPNKVLISIGRWYKPGATDAQVKEGWQFTVTGNTPDPRDISITNGMVKYEVTNFNYFLINNPTQQWGNQTFEGQVTPKNTNVEGVILIQMMETRLLKVETFPGKTAAEVTGFTANAQLYER